MRPLSPQARTTLEAALSDARAGRATLPQLAQAHAMAEGNQLNAVLGELREHIRRMTPAPFYKGAWVKSIFLGVVSGVITWFLLGRRR